MSPGVDNATHVDFPLNGTVVWNHDRVVPEQIHKDLQVRRGGTTVQKPWPTTLEWLGKLGRKYGLLLTVPHCTGLFEVLVEEDSIGAREVFRSGRKSAAGRLCSACAGVCSLLKCSSTKSSRPQRVSTISCIRAPYRVVERMMLSLWHFVASAPY